MLTSDRVINPLEIKITIWIFEALCILIGFLIIKYKPCINVSAHEIIFLIVLLIVFFFFLEGVARSCYFIINKINCPVSHFSEYIGWESSENCYKKTTVKEYGEIVYSTTKYGFRVFGDISTRKTKIFVIGDSHTQAVSVSDDNTYYNYLKENNDNIEIFAYGCGGYGSLQEYMILDKYFDIIQPDIILWQFCSNDIFNNDYELESASAINNNYMVRPYYKHGQIKYLYPNKDFGWIYNITTQYSYLLRLLNIRLRILKAKKTVSIEDELSKEHPLFKEAINTTSEIMSHVKRRVGDTPIIAFNSELSCPKAKINEVYSNICQKYGIYYIFNVPDALIKEKESGINVYVSPNDRHWNNVGHSIVGEILLNYLINIKLINIK